MKMKTSKKNISVMMDEEANYCIIVGTKNKGKAEKALREQEKEWYGLNHIEEPIPMNDFGYLASILKGEKNGEEFYYFGTEPFGKFDNNKVEILEGFVANL